MSQPTTPNKYMQPDSAKLRRLIEALCVLGMTRIDLMRLIFGSRVKTMETAALIILTRFIQNNPVENKTPATPCGGCWLAVTGCNLVPRGG